VCHICWTGQSIEKHLRYRLCECSLGLRPYSGDGTVESIWGSRVIYSFIFVGHQTEIIPEPCIVSRSDVDADVDRTEKDSHSGISDGRRCFTTLDSILTNGPFRSA
jgi:hypothetical protein